MASPYTKEPESVVNIGKFNPHNTGMDEMAWNGVGENSLYFAPTSKVAEQTAMWFGLDLKTLVIYSENVALSKLKSN